MPVKPHSTEEEYFAREDSLKKKKIAAEQAKKLAEKEKQQLKELHWMRCPKCGMELQSIKFRDVEIDRCYGCGGVWLDDGELDKIAQAEVQEKKGAVMRSILNIFGEPKKK
jgi:Pyruvate/2-oxoacid:ferredoxin oxidoreductase delta subunit